MSFGCFPFIIFVLDFVLIFLIIKEKCIRGNLNQQINVDNLLDRFTIFLVFKLNGLFFLNMNCMGVKNSVTPRIKGLSSFVNSINFFAILIVNLIIKLFHSNNFLVQFESF